MILKTVESSRQDWRWLIGVFVFSYALLVTGLPSSKVVSEKQLLQGLGVAALDHPLMDLRGVAAWCEAWSQGKNPMFEETRIMIPGEAKSYPNFLMNYSPLVLLLGKAGLSQQSVLCWGFVLAALYLIALYALCGPCTLNQALLWGLLICSPASVLVVERGNFDIMIFALLAAALLVRKLPIAESGFILSAAFIKFFPIIALGAPWRDRFGKGRYAVILALVTFLLFLFLLREHLGAIAGSLGGQAQSSFGASVPATLLAHSENIKSLHVITAGLRLVAFIGISVSCVAGFFTKADGGRLIAERAQHAFYLTAPLMLMLFVQGPQMDYKWIFFLFMVPAILQLIHSPSEMESLFAKAWLFLIVAYSYWTFYSDEGSLRNALLKQLLMWCIIFLSAFFTGSLWRRKILA